MLIELFAFENHPSIALYTYLVCSLYPCKLKNNGRRVNFFDPNSDPNSCNIETYTKEKRECVYRFLELIFRPAPTLRRPPCLFRSPVRIPGR